MAKTGKRRFAGRRESARIPGHADLPEGSSSVIARILRQAAPFMGAASVMTGALLGGLFGGRWLDGRFGTDPVFLVSGLVLGLIVGMSEIARVALGRGRTGRKGPPE